MPSLRPHPSRQHRQSQLATYRQNSIPPHQQIVDVIGEEFGNIVNRELADNFWRTGEFSPVCLTAADNPEAAEYRKRHTMAEYIVAASDFAPKDIDRARTFLHTLADVWMADQALYHDAPSKRLAYCPICQTNFFGQFQRHTWTTKNDDGITSSYITPNPMNPMKLKEHIRDRGYCFGHNLYGRFLNDIHHLGV